MVGAIKLKQTKKGKQMKFEILPPEHGSKTGEARLKYGNKIYAFGDDVTQIRKELEAIPEFAKRCVIWCGHFSPDGYCECGKSCDGCQYENMGILHIDS